MEILIILMLEYIPIFNVILTFLTNGTLIYLIIKKSPKTLANYKYLMLTFSSFGMFFGVIDLTDQPMLHFHKSGYIIFSKNLLGLPHYLACCYIALNCSILGMVVALLSFHFIYRYFAVCKPNLLYLFTFPYYFIFVIIHIFITFEWWISASIIGRVTPETDAFWRDTMFETYGWNLSDIVYISSILMDTDSNGNDRIKIWDSLFLTKLIFIFLTGFSIIIYLWIKIQWELYRKSKLATSQKTSEMQQQLFNALIAQTIVPTIFMFIPAGGLLFIPIFQLDVGTLEKFLVPVITTYPWLDALSTIYFIKAYRRSMLQIFCRKCARGVKGGTDALKSTTTTVFQVSSGQKESKV